MQVVPPSGGPSAAPPPGNAPRQPGQPGPAEQSIKMIQTGFQNLAKMIQGAQGKLPPEDIKLFQEAVQATDNFFQALMGDLQGGGPQGAPPPRPAPGGPMAANASAGSQPVA